MNAACTATAPNNFRNATILCAIRLLFDSSDLGAGGTVSYWDPDTNSAGDLIRQTDASLNWFLNGTYDHQIMLTYSNTQFETGGYAIGQPRCLGIRNRAARCDEGNPDRTCDPGPISNLLLTGVTREPWP